MQGVHTMLQPVYARSSSVTQWNSQYKTTCRLVIPFILRISFTIHCPPALIPRILNDSISFRKLRDGILFSMQLPWSRNFFSRKITEPSRLSCDCHAAASSGISQGCSRLSEALRGVADGSRGTNEAALYNGGVLPRQRAALLIFPFRLIFFSRSRCTLHYRYTQDRRQNPPKSDRIQSSSYT
ncbi:hypothetical protein DL98DRAFT_659586 [Cadophora sp. DSE1049]|nr:hypothetical protein DL98DRAFT_659586 [Cadophora sp. DSE1049]